MNQKQKEIKKKLTEKLDNDIVAIETRIANRKIQFDYENAKDQEKLDGLTLSSEGIKGLK